MNGTYDTHKKRRVPSIFTTNNTLVLFPMIPCSGADSAEELLVSAARIKSMLQVSNISARVHMYAACVFLPCVGAL